MGRFVLAALVRYFMVIRMQIGTAVNTPIITLAIANSTPQSNLSFKVNFMMFSVWLVDVNNYKRPHCVRQGLFYKLCVVAVSVFNYVSLP